MFNATMVPLADALNDFGIFALCIATTPRTAAPMPTSANTSPTSLDVVAPPAKDIPDGKRRPPYELPTLTGPIYPVGPPGPIYPADPAWGGPHGPPAGCPVGWIGCQAGLLNG